MDIGRAIWFMIMFLVGFVYFMIVRFVRIYLRFASSWTLGRIIQFIKGNHDQIIWVGNDVFHYSNSNLLGYI